jgi:2'-5' RNA ligase
VTRPDARPPTESGRQSVRAFIAVPLPDAIVRALGRVQHKLSRNIPEDSVRWVRPQGIHLTLKFLGDTPLDRLPPIRAALHAVAANAPAFTISVGGAGCFPNARRPRVVWIGIDEPQGRLARLHSAIEEALDNAGFPPEGRPFKPHLTLGRVNRRSSGSDASQVGETVVDAAVNVLGQVKATQIDLIRSILQPTGAEYTTLASFSLRDA